MAKNMDLWEGNSPIWRIQRFPSLSPLTSFSLVSPGNESGMHVDHTVEPNIERRLELFRGNTIFIPLPSAIIIRGKGRKNKFESFFRFASLKSRSIVPIRWIETG